MKKIFSFSTQPIALNAGLLLLRGIIGIQMALYGYDKILKFNTSIASDFWGKQIHFLGQTGAFPLSLTIFAELCCSILLLFGLLTRLSLIPLMFCMAFIVVSVEKFNIISLGNAGYEISHALVYLVMYVVLYLTGPGKYSLDYWLERGRQVRNR